MVLVPSALVSITTLEASQQSARVTFARDIAPLVFDRCGSCHRPSGAAPFSLLTYDEVRQRVTQIVAVTQRRFMPPWKVEPDSGPFTGQRPLGGDEIALIRRWADAGALEGDAREMPAPPQWAEGWQLGTPDLIVTVPQAYELQAELDDVFRIFVLPLPIDGTRYVRGIEFRPGNARVVHHANIRVDRTTTSREHDAADPAPGYDGLMPRSAEYPEGHFLGWTPGQLAPLVSPELAWQLDPGTDLVLQLHMLPSGTKERVQPSIGIYFSDQRPTRTPSILRLGSQGIDIPPGEANHVITDFYTLPVDVQVLAVQPHAHYRLRDAQGLATLPDGTSRMLIRITDWDFRWQHVYRYEQPVALPKGTTVSMRYTFDNSAANVRNPEQPPRRVLWGQRSWDEMGDLWFQLSTKNDEDRALLNREVLAKMTAEDIVGYETMLVADPSDAELHDDVALLYLGRGQAAEAVRHFSASVALKPDSAPARFNLGTALTVAGRLDAAILEYKQALTLSPMYASAHNNLGMVLATQGQLAEAIRHFRSAVRIGPRNTQALRNLSWHLATAPEVSVEDAEEAVRLAERAADLTGRRDPHVLDALAAAYAAAGAFERAVAIAGVAIRLVPDPKLAQEFQRRLMLYQQQRRYVSPASKKGGG